MSQATSNLKIIALMLCCTLSACHKKIQAEKIDSPPKTSNISNSKLVHCQDYTVSRFDVAMNSGSATAPTSFSYAYRRIKGNGLSKTVIIYLPGGPGGTSMKTKTPIAPKHDTIYIDPRSVGCNGLTDLTFPDSALTTLHLAQDVLSVINNLKLKNYIIYGTGYGTLWATVLADMIQQAQLPHPKSLVLAGTIGKAYDDDSYHAGYLTQWNKIKAELPKNIIETMEAADQPLGFDKFAWGLLVSDFLSLQSSATDSHSLVNLLTYTFGDNQTDEHRNIVKSAIETVLKKSDLTTSQLNLFKTIACNEFSLATTATNATFYFEKGELKPIEDDSKCSQERIAKPYDSADYQINSPIFYLMGELDPETPLWQTDYHHQNQNSKKKFTTHFKDLGHTILPILDSCAPKLWEIFTDQRLHQLESLNLAMESCAPISESVAQ